VFSWSEDRRDATFAERRACDVSGAVLASRVLKCSTILALAWFASGSVAGAQIISKTVATGGVLKVGHYATVNPDCSVLGMPVVRISTAPTHGVVKTMKTSGFSHFTAPFDRCNTRRIVAYQ
jgi:hypothetical protein